MATEETDDALILKDLQALGITLLCEWDTLVFVYSHGASLCNAAQIAKAIAHGKAEVRAAVHSLEASGLVQRSRVSQGIRLYQFSQHPHPDSHSRFLGLMSLAQTRTGRLLILRNLKRSRPETQRRRVSGLHFA